MQAMFTGFEDNGEILTSAQKIRLLFQKVQNPSLTQVKSAVKVQSDLDIEGTEVTYDFIANSLAAGAVSLPDHVPNRQTSGVDSQGGDGAPKSGTKSADGTIFTGNYANWDKLSNSEKHSVYEERKRLNVTSSGNKNRRRKASSINTKRKTLAKMNREIASLKTKVTNLKKKSRTSSDDDGDDDPQENAGDQFGGRKDKQKKKKDDQG